jgi:hypothetical protein
MKTKTNKILSFILCAVFSLCFFGLVLTYRFQKRVKRKERFWPLLSFILLSLFWLVAHPLSSRPHLSAR